MTNRQLEIPLKTKVPFQSATMALWRKSFELLAEQQYQGDIPK